jgi:DNA end-binding protein Ku
MWSGVVSFGMVSIPVRLYAATRARDISFNLLHATCHSRIEQKRWCPTEDVEVPWNEVVRGYQYAKDQYVVLTDEDFEQLPLPSKHTIELSAFVTAEEVDPVFYEKSYFLAPEPKGEKPYALLLKALEEKSLVAIATVTLRKKEQLCAVRPHGGTLLLETLYYPDEVELEREVDLSKAKLSQAELGMARTLIELLRKPFDPSEYQDRYREALEQLIEAKLEGKDVATAPPAREAKVIDLAQALKRSVAAAKKRGTTRGVASTGRSAPTTRRTRRGSTTRKAG